ncbi:3-hydroxy-9,10-secoandrosta-1,3,5(10)-triene-9,17-dione monooxygenase [Pseudomonas flavescens]|uniref:3-hydroxy-9,10-secoandrosta-1,3,5(10)-triene-9,17-dione monooxygenase n=1 Tax=Phytopseudomonas flavescens TaxID=29435 RepID=A0A1G8DHH4_9GAMM|nr:acyl-CoA dehydrogenase family protein [Pseudomonas flavescens]SDH57101.1 3-hydroxy-9,10-secoandrosta-1,3,5(10)-triene-9,17-dione monooxygenase [Pseudomonas flavescens]
MKGGVQSEQQNAIASFYEVIAELSPKWQARSLQADENSQLPLETFLELRDAKLFGLCAPKRFGGHSLPWNEFVQLTTTIAASCPATAWLVGLVGSHAAIIARMSEECQTEVFRDGTQQLFATASLQQQSTVFKCESSFVVSGKWSISSGIDFAKWVVLYVRHEVFGSVPHLVVLPTSQVSIIDDWNVFGLRATGSKSVLVSDAVIPSYRVINQDACFNLNPPGAVSNTDAPYFGRSYIPYLSSVILGPLLGTAKGGMAAALDVLIPSYARIGDDRAGAKPLLELAVAESAVELRIAEMLVANCSALLTSFVSAEEDRAFFENKWNAIRQDKAYVVKLCNKAMDRLADELGTRGVFSTGRFQLLWRDLKVMSKHMDVRWDRMMLPVGQELLKAQGVCPS